MTRITPIMAIPFSIREGEVYIDYGKPCVVVADFH